MPATPDLPGLVQYVVRGIVAAPDAVRVEEVRGAEGTVLRVHVAAEDRGKVIGRGGRVVRALRTLVRAAATRTGERVHVEIVEERAP